MELQPRDSAVQIAFMLHDHGRIVAEMSDPIWLLHRVAPPRWRPEKILYILIYLT